MITFISRLINLFRRPLSVSAEDIEIPDVPEALIRALERHHDEVKQCIPHAYTLSDISRQYRVSLQDVHEMYEHVVFRDDMKELERALRDGWQKQ
jgi:hypothetical protein